ncbi:MAG TPA: SIS domain-containing protein [Candidatus Dormibacteraeota bacterium]|nr:SIS domain-containing protein [Candidatus Dormibacteraeota bacterium]
MSEPHEPGSFLRATLQSQPRELARLFKDRSAERAAARLRDCRRIFITGTGTSFHGALAGQFMFRSAGLEAWAIRAFDFANYPPAIRDGDGLIVLSHRGTKRFSVGALRQFSETSNRWIAITGEGSPMEGDGVVRTVEQEKSPVHTASHTGAMLRLGQIATTLGRPTWTSQLAEIPDAVEAALELGDRIASDLLNYKLEPVTHFVGGGPARATAYEGALKLREASHLVSAEGHDVEGILHGPLVSIQPSQTVVLMTQPGASLERANDVAHALGEIGASVMRVGAAPRATYRTPEVDEVLAPMVNVIPLQWLAYHASRKLGVDADSFRRDEARYSAAQSKFSL